MRRLFALALMAFSLVSCDDRFPDYSYKMTVHAGGQAFSTVRHVEVTEGMSIVSHRATGEAVIIDHPNGKTYYALLARPDNADYAAFVAGTALRDHVPRPGARSEVQQAIDDYNEENSAQDSFGDAAEFRRGRWYFDQTVEPKQKPVFDLGAIGDHHLWRDPHYARDMVWCSDIFGEALEAANLTGFGTSNREQV